MKTIGRRWLFVTPVLTMVLAFSIGSVNVKAAGPYALRKLVGGVGAVLNPIEGTKAQDVINETVEKLNIELEIEEPYQSDLVMANVRRTLNVREEPSTTAKKVGKIYKDCGGTIIERGEEWTKIQSGNVVGWCSNEYLLFDEEADALAEEVGRSMATIQAEALRVRSGPGTDNKVLGLLPKGEVTEVVSVSEDGWVCLDYEGDDGYVSAEYVDIFFQIDYGETMEEIKAREAAEREAKRHVNYGAFMTDADTTLLLAALVYCEAGNQEYEGKVAVAAVVMNRVRSSAYPDTIHGVIYASGQFTPAVNGKVNNVYNSGKIPQSCIDAAKEALSGVSNVGDATHFRRNNGRDGIVIGRHVFY